MTVSKLAWPASSDAAVLAVSCLSELPVPVAVDRSTGIRKICQQHNNSQRRKNDLICLQPQFQKSWGGVLNLNKTECKNMLILLDKHKTVQTQYI